MMRNLGLICLWIFIGLSSCNKEDDENCNPESTNSKWTLGKDIIVNYQAEYLRNEYVIVDGENILFQYNHSGAQCDDVYDDEWGEGLTFVISNESTDFEFANEEIVDIKCFYQQYGAWVRHNQYQIKDGIIKGKRISENKWKINVSVTTTPLFTDEQPKKFEFSSIFSK